MTSDTKSVAIALIAVMFFPTLLGGCATEDSVAVEEVIQDLEYYYACQNEILNLPDGRTYYPLNPEEQDDFDDFRYEEPSSASSDNMFAVLPPGPGEDTGTLTIYEDDMAFWMSESGIEAWLTEERQTYDWEC